MTSVRSPGLVGHLPDRLRRHRRRLPESRRWSVQGRCAGVRSSPQAVRPRRGPGHHGGPVGRRPGRDGRQHAVGAPPRHEAGEGGQDALRANRRSRGRFIPSIPMCSTAVRPSRPSPFPTSAVLLEPDGPTGAASAPLPAPHLSRASGVRHARLDDFRAMVYRPPSMPTPTPTPTRPDANPDAYADANPADPRAGAPRFVVIMTDIQATNVLGCYGHPELRTPRLDALAAGGVAFNGPTPPPRCAPRPGRPLHRALSPELRGLGQRPPPGHQLPHMGQRFRDLRLPHRLHRQVAPGRARLLRQRGLPGRLGRALLVRRPAPSRQPDRRGAGPVAPGAATYEALREHDVQPEWTWGHRVSDRAISFLDEHRLGCRSALPAGRLLRRAPRPLHLPPTGVRALPGLPLPPGPPRPYLGPDPPPCASTSPRAIARPSPAPSPELARSPRQNRSNIRARRPARGPRPCPRR